MRGVEAGRTPRPPLTFRLAGQMVVEGTPPHTLWFYTAALESSP